MEAARPGRGAAGAVRGGGGGGPLRAVVEQASPRGGGQVQVVAGGAQQHGGRRRGGQEAAGGSHGAVQPGRAGHQARRRAVQDLPQGFDGERVATVRGQRARREHRAPEPRVVAVLICGRANRRRHGAAPGQGLPVRGVGAGETAAVTLLPITVLIPVLLTHTQHPDALLLPPETQHGNLSDRKISNSVMALKA